MTRSTSLGRGAGNRRPARVRWTTFAIGAALLLTPGCHTYAPSETGVTPVGEYVRLAVTREGGLELARVTGRDEVRPIVEGQLIGRESEALLIRVPERSRFNDPSAVELGQVVRVPIGEVLSIDQREFSRGRTALIIGGGMAAVFVAFRFSGGEGGTTGLPGNGPELQLGGAP